MTEDQYAYSTHFKFKSCSPKLSQSQSSLFHNLQSHNIATHLSTIHIQAQNFTPSNRSHTYCVTSKGNLHIPLLYILMKGGILINSDSITKRLTEISEEIRLNDKRIQELPEGNLLCCRNGKYWKLFRSDGHKHHYIPKKDTALAKQLAVKKYLTAKQNDLKKEQHILTYALRHMPDMDESADMLLKENSGYAPLLKDYFTPLSDELLQWQNADYAANPLYPEQLIFKTYGNQSVRSKSEVLIANSLFINKIPYRYENPLQLGDAILYPDFTIRHPQTGETFFWEHFGLMTQNDYIRHTFQKLQLYATNGIIPDIHLITTWETSSSPLDTELIDLYIRHYFL